MVAAYWKPWTAPKMRVGASKSPAAAQERPERRQHGGQGVVDGGDQEVVVTAELSHARAEREADIEDDVEREECHARRA